MLWQGLMERRCHCWQVRTQKLSIHKTSPPQHPVSLLLTVWLSRVRGPSVVYASHAGDWGPSYASPLSLHCEREKRQTGGGLMETPLGIQTAGVAPIMQTRSREQECRWGRGGLLAKPSSHCQWPPNTALSLAISLVLSSWCTHGDTGPSGHLISARAAQLRTVGATEEPGQLPYLQGPIKPAKIIFLRWTSKEGTMDFPGGHWESTCQCRTQTGSLIQEDSTGQGQLSPWATTNWTSVPRAMLCNKRSHCREKPMDHNYREAPTHWNQRKPAQQRRPSMATNK